MIMMIYEKRKLSVTHTAKLNKKQQRETLCVGYLFTLWHEKGYGEVVIIAIITAAIISTTNISTTNIITINTTGLPMDKILSGEWGMSKGFEGNQWGIERKESFFSHLSPPNPLLADPHPHIYITYIFLSNGRHATNTIKMI